VKDEDKVLTKAYVGWVAFIYSRNKGMDRKLHPRELVVGVGVDALEAEQCCRGSAQYVATLDSLTWS
jgi:hypothetical protein